MPPWSRCRARVHQRLPHGGPQPLPPARVPQVLQDLINVLPVSAKIPSEVDVELQRKVASFFQSETTVNRQLPRFRTAAREMRERWLARRAAAATPTPTPAPTPTPTPRPTRTPTRALTLLP